jgi:pimeloyl-ACP methyl ester carboxylesterase
MIRKLLRFSNSVARSPAEYAEALSRPGQLRDPYIMVRGSDASPATWIVFSHVRIPAGQFAQSRVFSHLRGASVFLNCEGNSWFHSGVPGAANSLESLSVWLNKIMANRDPGKTTIVGHSMGAYAALAMTKFLPHARFVATSPELILGKPGSRSLENGVLPEGASGSLYDFIPKRNQRAGSMTLFGAWDPVDARFLARRETFDGRFGKIYPVAYHHGVTEYLTQHRYYLSLLTKGNRYAKALRDSGHFMPVPTAEDRKRYGSFARLSDAVENGDESTFVRFSRLHADWDNPGWFLTASKGARVFGRKQQMMDSAAKAARLAPKVAEYPLHYGRMAADTQDAGALLEAMDMLKNLPVQHRAVDRFLAAIGEREDL